MNQHRYRANVADRAAIPDHNIDDLPEGGIKKPLILVVVLHLIAVAGLLVFAKFNAYRTADAGDSANDHRYTEAVDPMDGEGFEAVGVLPESEPAHTRPITHTVKNGELLQNIARQYAVDVQELAQINGMDVSNIPQRDQILKLPQGASAMALMAGNDPDDRALISSAPRATPTTSPASIDGVPVMRAEPVKPLDDKASATDMKGSYTVKPGDTLTKIASIKKTTPEALMKANGITDPTKLRAGEKLKVP